MLNKEHRQQLLQMVAGYAATASRLNLGRKCDTMEKACVFAEEIWLTAIRKGTTRWCLQYPDEPDFSSDERKAILEAALVDPRR